MPAIAVGSLGGGELAVSFSVPEPSGQALKPVTLTITTDNTFEDRYSPVSKRLLLNGHLRGRVRVPFGLGPPPTEVRAKTATRTNLQSDSVVVRFFGVRVTPQERADVVQVKRRYAQQLLRIYPGAVGVGVSTDEKEVVAPSKKAWIVMVFVESAADVPADPQSIGGVPIRFFVSGVVEAQ